MMEHKFESENDAKQDQESNPAIVDDEWITAIHEAAHAMIAYQEGLTVKEIRLRTDRTRNSRGYILLLESQLGLRFAKQNISILMAGSVASNIVTGTELWRQSGRDEREAGKYIIDLLDDGDEDFYELETVTRRRIIRTYWDECVRVTIREVTKPKTWRAIHCLAKTISKVRVLRLSQLRVVLYRLMQSSAPTARVSLRRTRKEQTFAIPSRRNKHRCFVVKTTGEYRWSIRSQSFHDKLRAKGRTLRRATRKSGTIPLARG